jgi:alcohol dehydrogenase YqhD (iron-dependent ADH family)
MPAEVSDSLKPDKRRIHMKNFAIYNPVRIIFGAGEINNAGKEAGLIGKKAIIITGKNSAKRSGLLDRVVKLLANEGVMSVLYSGVTPNPKNREVDEAAALAKKEKCDFVIGLGGGSAMDAAKGTAITAGSGGELWDYIGMPGKNAAPIIKSLPIMLIPTLAATGSEGNPAAVFTNTATNQKAAIHSPSAIYPKVSIVDPDLTLSVPAKQTAEGIIDVIMHVLEEYLTGETGCEVQDRITEGIIMTCMDAGRRVINNLHDSQARAQISLSSTLALQGMPNSGRAGAWVVHPLEHAVSAYHDNIAHGAGIAAILPSYLKYIGEVKKERVLQLADRIFTVPEGISEELKIAFCIENFRAFITGIGLADNFKDLGIGMNNMEKFADKVIELGGLPWKLDRARMIQIYKDAF